MMISNARILFVGWIIAIVSNFIGRTNGQSEDLLRVFDWKLKNCTDYPFFSDYDFCGVLEFCDAGTPGSSLYGYRQAGTTQTCQSPGPTIRVIPGNKYLLTLKNTVKKSFESFTNIHTHGLHVSGDGNADSNVRYVESGGCLHYSWDIQSNLVGGTHWYHPHGHKSSFSQTYGGGFGLVIVEDVVSTIFPGTLTNNASIEAFLKNEKSVFLGNIAETWYANGKSTGAALNININQWTRLRIGISNPIQPGGFNSLPVTIDTAICPDALVIAYDGVYRLDFPGTVTLPKSITGSSRIDIAIRCNVNGGKAFVKYGTNIVATLTIVTPTGTPAITPDPYNTGTTIWIPSRPFYTRDLYQGGSYDANTIDNKNVSIDLSNFVINGKQWDEKTPSATYAFDATNEWVITGSYNHPLHIHVHHFQVVSTDCGDHEVGQFYDTIVSSNPCHVRFAYNDFAGFTLLHCHDLTHQDNGMITWINVTGTAGIKSTLPSPLDLRCFEPAVVGSCRWRVENACQDGEGRLISYRSGSRCRQRCARNYATLVGKRVQAWNLFSPRWRCRACV